MFYFKSFKITNKLNCMFTNNITPSNRRHTYLIFISFFMFIMSIIFTMKFII